LIVSGSGSVSISFGFRFGLGLCLDQLDRPGDEVGVAGDDLADLGRRGVVVQVVGIVNVLEVQGDGGALRRVRDRLEGVGAAAVGLPAHALFQAGAAGHQGYPVGHHEAGVEADAEVANQVVLTGCAGRLLQFLQELGGAGLGDRANEIDHVVAAHPDAVVTHGECARPRVELKPDVQVTGVGGKVLVPEGYQPQLVQRIGGVRDQLTQEDILVRVD
jgi:hypothetical protein